MIQPATLSQAFKYHSGHLGGSKIELSPIATKLGRHEPTATNTTHTKFPQCAYASPVIDDRHMTIVVIANPLVFGHMAWKLSKSFLINWTITTPLMKLQFQLNKFQVNFLDTIVFFRNNNNQSKQLCPKDCFKDTDRHILLYKKVFILDIFSGVSLNLNWLDSIVSAPLRCMWKKLLQR